MADSSLHNRGGGGGGKSLDSALKANAIFLGDASVGKSSLIRSLCNKNRRKDLYTTTATTTNDNYNNNGTGITSVGPSPREKELDENGYEIAGEEDDLDEEDDASGLLLFSPDELGMGETSVSMKAWEYPAVFDNSNSSSNNNNNDSNNDNKINNNISSSSKASSLSYDLTEALQTALFCFILIDLRNPLSANSAFNKWIKLKEEGMDEGIMCFVVGTHLGELSDRQLEVDDIARACALKDAFYIEVCNSKGDNIDLLRNLICQRLIDTIDMRRSLVKTLLEENYDDRGEEFGDVGGGSGSGAGSYFYGKSRKLDEIARLKKRLLTPIEFTTSSCNIISSLISSSPFVMSNNSSSNSSSSSNNNNGLFGMNMRFDPEEWRALDRAKADMNLFVSDLERENFYIVKKIAETTRTIEQLNAYFSGNNNQSSSEIDDEEDNEERGADYMSGNNKGKPKGGSGGRSESLDRNFYLNNPDFVNLDEVAAMFDTLGFVKKGSGSIGSNISVSSMNSDNININSGNNGTSIGNNASKMNVSTSPSSKLQPPPPSGYSPIRVDKSAQNQSSSNSRGGGVKNEGMREEKQSSSSPTKQQQAVGGGELIKIRIKLPSGSYADMVINLTMAESQVKNFVASFLSQYNVDPSSSAFAKLENVVRTTIQQHQRQVGGKSSPTHSSNNNNNINNINNSNSFNGGRGNDVVAMKSCKFKFKIPSTVATSAGSGNSSPETVSVKINQGDNIAGIVRNIAIKYNIPHLSGALLEKITAALT